MGPTGTSRVLQIHPTRQCNLRCLHCYSSSSPQERDQLDVTLLCEAISDAAQEGYNVVSISGGEPLLYRDLTTLLRHAKGLNLRTTVTSNGILLNEKRLNELKGLVDVLAISVDGKPDSHDHIRNADGAFARMLARLSAVRESGTPFGFIFTLTQYNLDELDWVAEFARAQGARLLQVHPLERAGNATGELFNHIPDATESSYAWLLGQQLQHQYAQAFSVQVDVAFSEHVKANPAAVFVTPDISDQHHLTLSEQVSPLVIEADAQVVPIHYGFPRAYAIGNLNDAPLRSLLQCWRRSHLPSFHALCRRLYDDTVALPKPEFFNWYERLAQYAEHSTCADGSDPAHSLSLEPQLERSTILRSFGMPR